MTNPNISRKRKKKNKILKNEGQVILEYFEKIELKIFQMSLENFRCVLWARSGHLQSRLNLDLYNSKSVTTWHNN